MWAALRRPEEIPRLLGLCLVGVYLAGMCVIGSVAWRFHRHALTTDTVEWQKSLATHFARSLAPLIDDDRSELRLCVAEFAAQPGVLSCQVIDPEGTIIAAGQASLLGKKVGATPPIERAAGGGPHAPDPDQTVTIQVPIRHADQRQVGTLLARFAVGQGGEGFQRMWAACALALLAVLLALLLVYRALRQSLRPAAAIRDNLLTVGDAPETRLEELRLADELGAVASAWNRIVDLLAQMRRELAGVHSTRELVAAMEQMDRSRAKEILELLPDGLIVVDESGHPALVNHAARHLLNVTDDGGEVRLATLSADQELNRLLVRMTAPEVRNHRANVYHTIRYGEHETTLQVTVLKVELPGQVQGALVLLRDVSQQKHAERARDEFLQHVTHELRTPLGNIRAYTETLMEDILDDKEAYKECLNVINTEARRLGRLVEEVLQASQLEVGAVRLKVSRVDLGRLLQQTVGDLQAAADEKQIELRLDLPPKVPAIEGDKERLAVVFTNLLGNALKYTDAGGQVAAECRCQANQVEVAVRDTGVGIGPEELPLVFDKFFRSKSPEVQCRPGTGLGLATARHIARLHGGDITATSEPGQGSCFTVTLPAGEGGQLSEGPSPAEAAHAP